LTADTPSRPDACAVCGVKIEPWEHVCRSRRCQAKLEWENLSLDQRLARAREAGVGEFFLAKNDHQLLRLSQFWPGDLMRPGQSLYVCGPVGTGKTLALCCLVCCHLAAGHGVRLVNWRRMQIEVRATYQPASRATELDLLNAYAGLDVLCLDDLGAGTDEEERETAAARRLLYTVMDDRYANARITYVTGNVPPGELAQKYDPRIARRIETMCRIVVLVEPVATRRPYE